MKKDYRIKREKDFHNIIKEKNNFANKHFIIYLKKNNEINHFRIGISVSKKLGKAYRRNKLKRYVREVIKEEKNKLKNYDIIIILRKEAVNLEFSLFSKSLIHVLTKKKLLKKEEKDERVYL